MLIDAHGHIDAQTPASRLSTYAGVCRLDLVLVSNRDGASVPRGVPNLDEGVANQTTLDACEQHPRLRPLYWARPGLVDSRPQTLAGALAISPFLGAVFSPADNGYSFTDPSLDAYMQALATADRPAVLLYGNDEGASPSKAYELAQRHPKGLFILSAREPSPARWAEALDVVRRSIQKKDADLYLGTAHASADNVQTAVLAVGSERVVLGTNAMRDEKSHTPRHIALLEDLRQTLSGIDYRNVTGENAVRLFRLHA
jgi:hypothetical protein